MAPKCFWFMMFLCLLAAAHFVDSSPEMAKMGVEGSTVSESAATGINCGGLCGIRCSRSSRPNLCKRACGTCCARCGCVPPGTDGNYEACSCYASLTTHDGQRKCP